MRLFIPSRGRSDRLEKSCLDQIPPTMLHQVTLVLYPSEHDAYLERLQALGYRSQGVTIMLVPEGCGIARKRHQIGQLCADVGYGIFAMVDDDARFLIRKHPERWNLREADQDDVHTMFWYIRELLTSGYSHVGVSAREGNNRSGVGCPWMLVEQSTRTMRFQAFRTDAYMSVEHGRVQFMEDFDVHLQLLRAGHKTCCLGFWAQGQRETGEDGGCSVDRTREAHDAAAERLRELHPNFVQLRKKQNRSGALANRLEVTIAWKAAAAEGERMRRGRAS